MGRKKAKKRVLKEVILGHWLNGNRERQRPTKGGGGRGDVIREKWETGDEPEDAVWGSAEKKYRPGDEETLGKK